MALFEGEEIVDVPTADGRTLKLPRSLVPASMLPQIGQQPGFTDETAYNVNPEIPSLTGGQLPPVDAAGNMMSPENVSAASQEALASMGSPVVDALGQTAAALGGGAAQTASAADGFVENAPTNAQLAERQKQAAYAQTTQGQLDTAQGQSNAADADAEEAIRQQTIVQAAEDEATAEVVGERNKELNTVYAKRNADMLAAAQAEEAKTNEIVSLRKKIAGTKIDRKADHPILAAIMAALAGLGSAMKGEKIDTLDILYRAIDRKVAAQEADLDQMGKTYGMTRDELQMLKDKSKSKLEFHNAMIAAETDKAARQLEELIARSSSDKTKANGNAAIAALRQRAADKTMEATRWGLDFKQKEEHQKQQIGLGWAGLRQSDRHHAQDLNERARATDLGAQIDRERIAADLSKALAADRRAGDEAAFKMRLEMEKENRQFGIKGVDNQYLLTPAGRAKMDEAAKLEEQAKQIGTSNPDAAAVMQQKASILRGQANTEDVVKGRSDTQSGEMSKKYAAAQAMIDVIDSINLVYDKAGRQLLGRDEAQAELQSLYKLLNVKGKDAWQLGAWDKGSATLSADIFGADPSAWAKSTIAHALTGGAVGDDPNGFKKRLEAVAGDVQNSVRLEISKNSTWDGKGDLFTRKKAPEFSKSAVDLSKARSGVEWNKDADQTGVVGKTARAVGFPFSPSHAEEAAQSQSLRYPGLSVDQEAPFEERLQAYKAGDVRAGDELITTIAEAAATRPDQALPLLRNIRTFGGETLYAAARSAIPKGSEVDKVITQEDTQRVGVAMIDTPMLAQQVLSSVGKDGIGDTEGLRELGRRAGQKDPEARRALAAIMTRKAAPPPEPVKPQVFGAGLIKTPISGIMSKIPGAR